MLRPVLQVIAIVFLVVSCGEADSEVNTPQPLVYEGMSASELREVLGEPLEIETKNEIFDAQTMKKMTLEQWVYEKRTVLLINDTVKNPKLN